MKKMVSLLLSAVLVMSILLVGCSPKKDGETTDKTDGTKTEGITEDTKTEEQQTLTVTTWDNAISPQFTATVEAFEKKFPNVTVEMIDTTANEYDNKLAVVLAAAAADPDVIFVKDAGTLNAMAEKKQILSLDEYIQKDAVDLSIYKSTVEQLQVGGANYSLPFRLDWYVVYYNKDLFDAAGVNYPTGDITWEEYEELAGKLTSGDGSEKVYGAHIHTTEGSVTNWAVQDGQNTVVAKDYTFFKPYYEWAIRMQDADVVQDFATLKTTNIHYSSVFQNQQAAMMTMGTWFIPTLMKEQAAGNVDFNWGITRIPHSSTSTPGATVGSITPVAISATTDVPDIAWEFVKFASSEETANILAQQGILTAIQTEESINTITSAELFPKDDVSKEALSYTSFLLDRPLDPDMAEVRTVLKEVHELIMIGEYTVDEGIAELNKRVGEIKGW